MNSNFILLFCLNLTPNLHKAKIHCKKQYRSENRILIVVTTLIGTYSTWRIFNEMQVKCFMSDVIQNL